MPSLREVRLALEFGDRAAPLPLVPARLARVEDEPAVPNTVDEAALRHGASVEQETTDQFEAYARFANREPTRYREGWLPE